MANTRQAKKRVLQAERNRQLNTTLRSMVRTFIKKVRKAIVKGNHGEAVIAFREAVPVIDRMAAKRIIPKNAAARYKSRLNLRIKNLAAQPAA